MLLDLQGFGTQVCDPEVATASLEYSLRTGSVFMLGIFLPESHTNILKSSYVQTVYCAMHDLELEPPFHAKKSPGKSSRHCNHVFAK